MPSFRENGIFDDIKITSALCLHSYE